MLFRILTFILLLSQIKCVSIALEQITAAQGIYFKETAAQKALGTSVSGIGDINGDGINDVIIGAPIARSGLGDAYVIYGGESAPSELDFSVAFAPEIGFTIKGAQGNLGAWVSDAGDINGDGISDLAVGAPGANLNAGVVYVIYGSKKRASDVDLTVALNPQTEGFTINGLPQGKLGSSVSCAGDVNGDEISDIIIGAPNTNLNGCAYVIYGSKTRQTNIDIPALDQTQGFSLCGTFPNGQFAKIVSGAGDVNGDGVGDVMIGVPSAESSKGKVYVIFGKKGGLINMSFAAGYPTLDIGFTVTGKASSRFGSSIGKVGDVNGDQIDDIIMASPSELSASYQPAPKAYVLFGKKGGLVNLDLGSSGLLPDQGIVIAGPTGSYFASFVAGAGDYDGDGFRDIFLGSPSMGSNGAVHVLYGKVSSDVTITKPPDLSTCSYFEGSGLITTIGSSGSNIGDFNLDGIDDIIIGGYNANMAKGVAYIVFGSSKKIELIRFI